MLLNDIYYLQPVVHFTMYHKLQGFHLKTLMSNGLTNLLVEETKRMNSVENL